jgi:hypothetical protein
MPQRKKTVKTMQSTWVRIDFRAPEEWVEKLDEWRQAQPGGLTRSQSLRYLVEEKLKELTAKKKN